MNESKNESNRTGLIIAFVVVIVLFLVFGGGAMSGSFFGGNMMGNGGGMMNGGGGVMENGSFGRGGYGWMWLPTVITLAIGIMLGWMIFGKKK